MPQSRRFGILVLSGCIGAVAAAILTRTHAGPLDPPAGPVAPSYKTLTEVEPRTIINDTNTPGDADSRFRITKPGSYYLDRSFAFTTTQISSKSGIEIDADDVTVDLNGFSLTGLTTGRHGIVFVPGRSRIRVINGHLSNWGLGGINGPNSSQIQVENIDIAGVGGSSPGAPGISVNSACTIRNCTLMLIGSGGFPQPGIATSNDVLIDNCVITTSTAGGIVVGGDAQVSNCSTYALTGNGVNIGGGRIEGCIASGCTGVGFTSSFTANISGCQATDCDGGGIVTSGASSSAISNCTVGGGAKGIHAGPNSTIAGCTSEFSLGDGISAGSFSLISHCTVNGAGGNGFVALGSESTIIDSIASQCATDGFNTQGGGCLIERCAARNNIHNGMRIIGSDNIARNNLCDNHSGGVGILVDSTDCRIEANQCTDGNIGIQLTGGGSIVVRNTCSGNATNYSIAAGNSFGAIVTASTNGALVTGNAASNLTTADPWANIQY